MHKRQSKRAQIIQLTIIYSLMSLAVIALVAVLALVVMNYRFNVATGTLEQRGLIQFASTPSGATVEVDATTLPSKTSTKYSVDAGEHRFAVWREGYETWHKAATIQAGSLTWFNYIRLVPKDRPVKEISSYAAIHASLASPTQRSILLHIEADRPVFRLVDVSSTTPQGQTLVLPPTVYAAPSSVETPTPPPVVTDLVRWDESGRYVLLKITQEAQTEWVVMDTQNIAQSVNVTREFSLPIAAADFSGRSGNILYILSDHTVRRLDITGGTISRALADNAADFRLYDDNAFVYTTRPSDSGTHALGVYRDGDLQPHLLRSDIPSTTPLSAAIMTYYGVTYTAISEGATLTMYRGQLDNGIEGLIKIGTYTIGAPINSVEFNSTGSHVVARAGSTYATYSVEDARLTSMQLPRGASADFTWIDAMHLGVVIDGVLTMRDIDGSNIVALMPAVAGQMHMLSRNGTFVYSIGTRDSSATLQRITIVL